MQVRLAILVVLALAATSFGDPVPPRGDIISSIIRKALESLRPNLKDLEIPTLAFTVEEPGTNLDISFGNGLAEKLEKFELRTLTTTLIPLKVTNMTIVLDEVKIKGVYSMNGDMTLPGSSRSTPVDGRGEAEIELKKIFFTIAGKFALSGKSVKIVPGGLYGFDLYVGKSKFELDNLSGAGEKGELFGKYFPDYVNKLKHPLFEKYRDVIIELINQQLSSRSFDTLDALDEVHC